MDPSIDDGFANCGEIPHTLATPTTNKFITDVARRSAQVNRTPRHVSWTGRDGGTPGENYIAVRSPGANYQDLLEVPLCPQPMG